MITNSYYDYTAILYGHLGELRSETLERLLKTAQTEPMICTSSWTTLEGEAPNLDDEVAAGCLLAASCHDVLAKYRSYFIAAIPEVIQEYGEDYSLDLLEDIATCKATDDGFYFDSEVMASYNDEPENLQRVVCAYDEWASERLSERREFVKKYGTFQLTQTGRDELAGILSTALDAKS